MAVDARHGRLAAVLLGLWLVLGLAFSASAEAGKYAVLGDSYSAGNGASVYDLDESCVRSSKAYGPLIRADLGAAANEFIFYACSGAVVEHMTRSGQGSNPIQVNELGADVLDVTFSIGGNDAGFSDVLVQCGLPLVNCDSNIDGAQNFINQTLPIRLNEAYAAVRQKAPNARVAVLGYPRLFPANGDDCSALTFFSAGEITRLNQTADLLAEVTRERARAHGFSFIDSRPAFLGHAWCEEEWINGLSNPTNKSYHPNDAGYVGFSKLVKATHRAAPQPSFVRGPNGRIAFSSNRDGNREIYVINGNGSFPVNLTRHAAADRDPVFSPDGTEILFASDRDGDFEIYKMPSAGGTVTRLTSNSADDLEPGWAPNGKQIVFRSNRDGNDEIYKMDASGGGQTRLTQNSASDTAPAFSPDGAEIAFQRFTAGSNAGQGHEVFKMIADGQGQTNLTANAASVEDGAPEWSPDGSRIAFHSNRSGEFEIYTMTATGSSVTRLTNQPGNDRHPVYSPAGAHIAFESDRSGTAQIYTMDASGAGPARRTTGSASELAPSWQGDSRPPVTSLDQAPPANTNNSVASFSFSSDEPGSSFECNLDGAGFAACSSPFVTDPLEDGSHSFAVRATDPSGNVDPAPVSTNFTIDTAGKLTTITASPAGPTNVNQPSFEFVSEDEGVTFECRLFVDGEPVPAWDGCESPFAPGLLPDARYRFEVRGVDGLGNVEDPPQHRDFTVDTEAPETSVTFGPAAIGVNRKPVFEFTADQAGVTFECRLNGAAGGQWTACQSPFPAGTLSDGDHLFEVRATDPAGNLEPEPASASFRIDTAPPRTVIAAGPSAEHPSAAVSFDFGSDEAGVRFECRLDSFDDTAWTACSSPRNYSGLNHGRHSFQVRAVDQAGNVELPPATSEFGVKTDPGLRFTSVPGAISSDAEPEITFGADDPDMDFQCRFDGGEWEACASPFRPGAEAPLGDGQHSLQVRGTDWFGEVVTLPVLEWSLITGPPQPEIIGSPPRLDNSRTATFRIDVGGSADTVECQIDGLAWLPCDPEAEAGANPVRATYSGLHDGSHRFRIRASNPLFGAGPEASFEWTIDATPPVAKFDRAPARRTGSGSSTWEFSGAGGSGGYLCRIDGVRPEGSLASGIQGFGTCSSPLNVTVTDGDHVFELIAIDEARNLSQSISRSWSVDTTGPVIEFTGSPDQVTTSRDATFEFRADEPVAAFRCRLDGGEWRSCGSPVTHRNLAAGSHSFEIEATDSLGNVGQAARQWQIEAIVKPPRPAIVFKRQTRLNRAGKAVAATVRCPAGSACSLRTPKRLKVRAGKRKVTFRILAPKRIGAGKKAAIRVSLAGKDRRKLGRRAVRLRLRLTATPARGNGRSATGPVRIRP